MPVGIYEIGTFNINIVVHYCVSLLLGNKKYLNLVTRNKFINGNKDSVKFGKCQIIPMTGAF